MHAYRLKFKGAFHVDSRGNDNYEQSDGFIRSDTLSAAVLSAWALLEPESAAERAKAPPFRLSSAFPYRGETHFLPRPIASLAVRLDRARFRDNKKLKKIQWLSESLWRRVAAGFPLNDAENLNIQGVLALEKNETVDFREPLWTVEERPRLALDRADNSAVEGLLFHFGRVWFHPDGGLYFLARFDDQEAQASFEAALRLLGDLGIGADRSNGNGAFSFERIDAGPGLKEPHEKPAVALSLVNPAPSDCREGWLDHAAYKLVSRGGWVGGTGLRKKRLRMFAEGSVFSRPLAGRVADVTPPGSAHPVYRDGRGFFVALEA
jgi:CRISPR-associated protein Csm4